MTVLAFPPRLSATVAIVGRDEDTGIVERLPVFAEPTTTSGLFITRARDATVSDDEGWAVTHGPSGRRLPLPHVGVDIILARRIAAALGTLGVDWSADLAGVVEQMTPDVTARVRDTVRRLLAGEREEDDRG